MALDGRVRHLYSSVAPRRCGDRGGVELPAPAPRLGCSGWAPSACLAPAPPPVINYAVAQSCTPTGSTPGLDDCTGTTVTFVTGSGGIGQDQVNLPWTGAVSRPPFDGFVDLSAQITGSGSITCTISEGGRIIDTETATGEFVIADCQGTG